MFWAIKLANKKYNFPEPISFKLEMRKKLAFTLWLLFSRTPTPTNCQSTKHTRITHLLIFFSFREAFLYFLNFNVNCTVCIRYKVRACLVGISVSFGSLGSFNSYSCHLLLCSNKVRINNLVFNFICYKICCARRCSGFLVWQKHHPYLTLT